MYVIILSFPKCQNIYRCAYLPIKSAVKSAAILFAADHNYIAKGWSNITLIMEELMFMYVISEVCTKFNVLQLLILL